MNISNLVGYTLLHALFVEFFEYLNQEGIVTKMPSRLCIELGGERCNEEEREEKSESVLGP